MFFKDLIKLLCHVVMMLFVFIINSPLQNAGALCDGDVLLSVRLSVACEIC